MKYFFEGSGRQIARKLYRISITLFWRLVVRHQTDKKSIIFSPHQDDETLGCGGVIIKKSQNGAKLKVVYMADGSHSHTLLAPEKLKNIRIQEAIGACAVLGVDKNDIMFMDFEDGLLRKKIDEAVEKVSRILLDIQPEEVFIPYSRDGHTDHYSTNRIVISALKKTGQKVTVYEYPIWFWNHWPNVGVQIRRKKDFLNHLKIGVKSGLTVFRKFNYAVRISEVLEIKKRALEQHKSQMTKLVNDEQWITLKDLSEGEWLDSFLGDFESFFRYELPQKEG
jgi:LmbE family N-acetylglucosaminyl deacetylase